MLIEVDPEVPSAPASTGYLNYIKRHHHFCGILTMAVLMLLLVCLSVLTCRLLVQQYQNRRQCLHLTRPLHKSAVELDKQHLGSHVQYCEENNLLDKECFMDLDYQRKEIWRQKKDTEEREKYNQEREAIHNLKEAIHQLLLQRDRIRQLRVDWLNPKITSNGMHHHLCGKEIWRKKKHTGKCDKRVNV
jgi:hypothetical protein